MLRQFVQNVVDALNAAQEGAWAPPIYKDEYQGPSTKIYKQAWYAGKHSIDIFFEISCANNGQRGRPPYNINITAEDLHPGMTRVRFADNAIPAPSDAQAITQCVEYIILNANKLEAFILRGGTFPVVQIPANLVHPAGQISRLQQPDPYKEIVLATEHMHSLIKPIEAQLDFAPVENHFLCRIVWQKQQEDDVKILFNGLKPKFNQKQAKEIHTIEDARRSSQAERFSTHPFFRQFRSILSNTPFQYPDQHGVRNLLAAFTDSVCFVADHETAPQNIYLGSQEVRSLAVNMFDMYLSYYKPKVVVNYGKLSHDHLLNDYIVTYGLKPVVRRTTNGGNYKRLAITIGDNTITFLSTNRFIPGSPADDLQDIIDRIQEDLDDLFPG
jgi:hypothetical protein